MRIHGGDTANRNIEQSSEVQKLRMRWLVRLGGRENLNWGCFGV